MNLTRVKTSSDPLNSEHGEILTFYLITMNSLVILRFRGCFSGWRRFASRRCAVNNHHNENVQSVCAVDSLASSDV